MSTDRDPLAVDYWRGVHRTSYDFDQWDAPQRELERGRRLIEGLSRNEVIFHAAMNTPHQIEIFVAIEESSGEMHDELCALRRAHAPRPPFDPVKWQAMLDQIRKGSEL